MRNLLVVLPALLAACGEVTTNGNDNPPPLIEAVSPERGGVPGGSTVTVTGRGFTENDAGENHVVVGMLSATDVTAADDVTLTFTLPPGPAPGAIADLVVFNNNGFAVQAGAIEYNPLPRAISASTGFVSSGGGTSFTIEGLGFEELDAGDNRVLIGGVEATSVEVDSDTQLTVEAAERPTDVPAFEALDLVVENANGRSVLPGAMKYSAPGLLLVGSGGPTHKLSWVDLEADPIRVVTLLQDVSVGSGSMAVSPDGVVYLLRNTNTGGARALMTVDPLTGVTEVVGPFDNDDVPGAPDAVRDFAFVGNTMIAFLRNERRLAEIDLDTAIWTPIGAVNAYPDVPSFGVPLAIGRRDSSSVWVASTTTSLLRRMSTTNSNTVDGPTLQGDVNVGIYALLNLDGDLLALTRNRVTDGSGSRQSIIRINTTNGNITELLDVPSGYGAISATPASF